MPYTEYEYNDELYHYGVLGMKWGVRKDRRGSGHSRQKPPTFYDRDPANKLIPAGSSVYRISSSQNETGTGPMYVTANKRDAYGYTKLALKNGKVGYRDSENKSDGLYAKEIKLKEDVRIPSKDTMTEAWLSNKTNGKYLMYTPEEQHMYRALNQKNAMLATGAAIYNYQLLKQHNSLWDANSQKYTKYDPKNPDHVWIKEDSEKLVNTLKDWGFNALPDVNGSMNRASQYSKPLVIIDAEKTLGESKTTDLSTMSKKAKKTVKDLTWATMYEDNGPIIRALNRKGRRVSKALDKLDPENNWDKRAI